MEAKGKHNFNKTSDEEISFCRGDLLKVISIGENGDENWYKAEKDGHVGYIPSSYVEITPHPWFLGDLSKAETISLLMERTSSGQLKQPDGAFVIRPSEGIPGNFSISVKIGDNVEHFRIAKDPEGLYSVWDSAKFGYLSALVQYYEAEPINREQTCVLRQMVRDRVRAKYDFNPTDATHLRLVHREIVDVLSREADESGMWWRGELVRDGRIRRGLFPYNYVEEM